MNLRWMLFNHVPAGVELSREQRRELGRRVKILRRTRPFMGPIALTLVAALAGSAVASMLFGWGLSLLIHHRPSDRIYVLLLLGLIFGYMAVLQIVIAAVVGRFSAPYVRAALNEMGIPVCAACGYNLTHLGEAPVRCPECGAPSPPIVKPVEG